MKENFRRVHFFNGMLATEDDWNAAEAYQRESRRFQNRYVSGAGVIPHFREGLVVRATQPAGLRVTVQPGAALDPQGREVLVLEPQLRSINPEEFAERGTPFSGFLFVVARYDERPESFAVSAVDARIQGHKRVAETALITVQKEEPRDDGIELARIYWAPECSRVTDALDFSNPRPGEIDLRFVAKAGQSGGRFDPVVTQHLLNSFERRSRLLSQLMLEFGVMEANIPRPGLMTARTLLKGGNLDRPTTADLLRHILDLEEEMTVLIQKRSGEWERVWVSTEYKNYLDSIRKAHQQLRSLENGPLAHMESIHYRAEMSRALDQFRQVNDALEGLLRRLPEMLEQVKAADPYPEITAEQLAVWALEMPRRFALGGTPYVLVDQLDVTNVASEEAHRFRIDAGPKDVVEGTTPATYPGGGAVTDSGISFRRGSIQFTVGDLVPGRDVLLVRRVELRDLNVEEEVRVDDQVTGSWRFDGNDAQNTWRNVLLGINGEFVAGPRPRVRLQLSPNSSPSNLYRVWVYQSR